MEWRKFRCSWWAILYNARWWWPNHGDLDGDGYAGEDWYNGYDDDGDGLIDEDYWWADGEDNAEPFTDSNNNGYFDFIDSNNDSIHQGRNLFLMLMEIISGMKVNGIKIFKEVDILVVNMMLVKKP